MDRDTRGGDGQGREGAEERGGGKNTKEKVSEPYQSYFLICRSACSAEARPTCVRQVETPLGGFFVGRGGLSILRWLLPVIFTTIIEIAMGKAHLLFIY